ncbi:ATP-dependent helicase [Mycobacterium shimoidei]|uniref:ATP-dependent helicase n=1 Tax=Mycobacterium shimoidei TaxID=29313 RepID=UPI0008487C98|nr:ATP-dependent DNA helicase [Mycobacterium shimoidei]MCV7260232.1 ATP-dependent helicase [Mycobacterium shimoidei]ODR12878.1 ATP-dependent DNA helicase [Mycobacterium shimoidei]ORW80764.1 ATP-dependent DNA helicase [Mycobacterium shimoidei]
MAHRWGRQASAVLDPNLRGRIRVLGGPGTGKSSLLVDAAAARIAAGADPESVLLLTGSGRISTATRSALTTQLLQARADHQGRSVIREPLVRTVHSYAFAVLRLAAQRAGGPPPRLVTSAEQDAMIAELLAGDLQDGPAAATAWPAELRPALRTAGFAAELRDLLARCAERGVDPRDLQRLGRLHGHPGWVAAGQFAQQYEQVLLLRAAVGTAAPQATTPAVGAAELVGAALEAFAVDPELLAAERARVRVLLVDDAQQLDRQACRLVRVLAAGADTTLIAGDPSQAVFGFRGGDPAALLDDESPSVTLTTSHRCAPAAARAISGVAGRLVGKHPRIDGGGTDSGSVTVGLAASAQAEAALIADALRRAHLIDGVPWSEMAVIVRSVPRVAAGLTHALTRAGVPVAVPSGGGLLCEQPAARALLSVLAATADGLTGERALELLTGPIGRIDPVTLRQLRRTLRRGAPDRQLDDLLVQALRGDHPSLPAAQARPLRRVRAVLDAAARCHRDGHDPRYTLWAAWHRSGLQRRWLTAWQRGGTAGAQAGRDLDAVTALFDITDQYVSRTPGGSLRGLLDHVGALQFRPPHPEPGSTEEVSVLSAHAALGHEWDVVVIAGLQEGLWPNVTPRGGVLGTQRLLDVIDGIGDNASMRAPLLAEERQLLVAAMGRARRRLLVTAVDSDDGGTDDQTALPSPFFFDVAEWATDNSGGADTPPVAAPRVLSAAAVVGRLRGVVCAPDGAVPDAMRASAATQLARLARAGVPGADPATWYGMAPISTAEPLWSTDDHVVTLTPSSLQTLTDCPLRWLVERHGGTDPRDLRSTIGSVLHALIAEPHGSESTLLAALDRAWQQLPFESRWYAANELARHRAMLQAFLGWRAQTRGELTEVGVEVDVDGVVDGVRLRGRVDRLERDAAGRLVIVDIKTGKTPVSKDDAQRHAQLAAYQLAVAEGLVSHGDEPGGARLVYLGRPNAGGPTEREQDPLTPALAQEWRELLRQASAATAGPQFVARINDGCTHCPMRPSCPAHTEESQ